MNEQSIQKQYNQIVSLLEYKRLKEALVQLDAFLYNSNDWTLRNRLEQIQTSYQYMLQYMKLGMKDPERHKLYRQLLADTWEIADQTRILLLDEISTYYYHSLRRNPNQLPKAYDLSAQQRILEGFSDEMAVSQLANYQGLDAILKRHEETHQVMFLTTWSNNNWTLEEFAQAEDMLRSETLPINDLCLFVSAVTLSLMECFDERKINWLLDGLRHTHPQINQRALVGLVITLHLYPTRITLYPELEARISLFREDPDFSKQVNRVYIQLLRSQETEKIDKKMREEIIPEMMRNVNIMRNMKFGFEETDENDRNPDWEQAFEQSGLGDKIREMNDLQLEGADVYMSTFAQLKGYPFFREPHNWFYPFDRMHSSIIHQVGLNQTSESSVLSIILQSGFFCNSDKYSFCFTIAQLPQGQRDMMLSQMTPQDQSDFMEEKNSASLKQYAERPDVISNQYIHDLYRFFKLSQRRNEFHNIFQEEIALHRNPVLKELLSAPELLVAVADFHFRKEHPAEALELYRILIDRKQANADIFQKTGFCLQKEKRYQEAVDAYLKGELVSTGVNCDHHHHEDGHSCGSHENGHSCGGHEDGHSCGGCGGGCGSQPSITGPNVGKTCRTHYRGTFNDGTQFDSSYDRGEPLEFICGAGQMIKGFDAAVANMEVGQVVDVHLMPEEAYGMPNPDAIFTLEIEQLPGAEDLTVGQQVYLSNQYGQPFPVKVNAKDEKTITFDANHEMAGKELNFRIELVEVK